MGIPKGGRWFRLRNVHFVEYGVIQKLRKTTRLVVNSSASEGAHITKL
jgi:hypothetical protein